MSIELSAQEISLLYSILIQEIADTWDDESLTVQETLDRVATIRAIKNKFP